MSTARARLGDELRPHGGQARGQLARQGHERPGGRDRAPDGIVLACQQSSSELLLRRRDPLEGRAQAAPRLADLVLERGGRREIGADLLLRSRE
jgi:hypothetical protein